jgi:putative aldouronate transport system substrate-binding protein
MSKFKKVVHLLLVVCLITGLVFGVIGCGTNQDNAKDEGSTATTSSTQQETSSSKSTPVTLTAVFPGNPPQDESNVLSEVNKKLKADGLNIIIKTSYIADYWNKLAMTVAGQTEIDVAWAHASTLSALVAKKVYQPIDEVFDADAPDIKANTPDYVLKGGTINGKLYAIARVIPMAEFPNVYNIRGDLREKYGLPPIKTVSDLEKYFDAVLKNDPDMYCNIDPGMQQLYAAYANYYFPIGDGGVSPVYIDPKDSAHTVKTFFDSEAFAKVCATKKSWRDKGYIPADTSKVTDPTGGFINGKVACVYANIMSKSEQIEAFSASVPNGKIETVLLTSEPFIFQAADNMLAVPSTSKHVKEAVQFINWIKKNQENYDLWSFGVKGVNYSLDGEAVSFADIPTEKQYITNNWMWNDIRIARFSSKMTKEDIDILKNWDANAVKTPFIGFTLDQEKAKTQVSQVLAVMNEYFANLAIGSIDYNTIKSEVEGKLNAAGIEDIVKEVQTQLDAFLAANK